MLLATTMSTEPDRRFSISHVHRTNHLDHSGGELFDGGDGLLHRGGGKHRPLRCRPVGFQDRLDPWGYICCHVCCSLPAQVHIQTETGLLTRRIHASLRGQIMRAIIHQLEV